MQSCFSLYPFHNPNKRSILLLTPAHALLWILLLGCIGSTVSCTNRNVYELIQQNRLQACEERPIPQQAACKESYQTDYDVYRRERDQPTT